MTCSFLLDGADNNDEPRIEPAPAIIMVEGHLIKCQRIFLLEGADDNDDAIVGVRTSETIMQVRIQLGVATLLALLN